MPSPVPMPKLGMTMEEGKVLSWEVALGSRVEKGATLFILESEKAEVEIEATASGYLRHIYVDAEQTVPCGTLLAALTETRDEDFDADAFRAEHDRPQAVRKAPPAAAAPRPGPARAAQASGRKAVAPAARKRARELDVDLDRVVGTGPGGRVTRQDVEAFAEATQWRIEIPGRVALDVPRQGEGNPLLLLPGFGTDVSVYARQTPELAADYCVLGVNPRGVGLSDAPESDVYEVAEAAEDAAALIGEPAHIVGTSLGAAVALEIALLHPGKVRSLSLVAPFAETSARLLSVIDAWTALAAQVAPELVARALLPWLFSTSFLEDEAARERTVRGLAATLARVPATTLPRVAAGLRSWSGTRSRDLGKIAIPTLVVVGGEDLLTPGGGQIAEAIPGARLVLITAAGHALGIEAADELNASLREHLRSS